MVLAACVHGRFVGTSFVPTPLYSGQERPEAELATLCWGKMALGREGLVFAPLLAVDGKDCSTVNTGLNTIPGTTSCTQVVQVLPGAHAVTGYSRTQSDVTLGVNGKVTWNAWPHVTIDAPTLQAGHVYSLEPDLSTSEPGIRLVDLCESSDHITTVKGYLLADDHAGCR
jgi:hypothetical protein